MLRPAARAPEHDVVIPYLRGGVEYVEVPPRWQVESARAAVDAGARVIEDEDCCRPRLMTAGEQAAMTGRLSGSTNRLADESGRDRVLVVLNDRGTLETGRPVREGTGRRLRGDEGTTG